MEKYKDDKPIWKQYLLTTIIIFLNSFCWYYFCGNEEMDEYRMTRRVLMEEVSGGYVGRINRRMTVEAAN